jgi:hypothetical protein
VSDLETLADLAAEYARHAAAVKPHLEAMEELKEQFRAMLPGTGDHIAGNLIVNVQANNRMDQDKFRADYPPDKFPGLYKQAPDMDAIPATVKRSYYKPGKPKVTVK